MKWLKKLFRTTSAAGNATGPASALIQAGNPSKGPRFSLSVEGPAGQRSEEVDLVRILAGTFSGLGRRHTTTGAALIDTASGIEFRPGIASFQPNDDLSMKMCTTIEIRHPPGFPCSFFEYQHSSGGTAERAVARGFEDWAALDLPVILDALNPTLSDCTALELQPHGSQNRRVLLGPVWRVGEPAVDRADGSGNGEPHPPGCRCCFFTNSMKAFMPLVESGGFHAVRLFAIRNPDGTASADCRINGDDYPAGIDALMAYARRWPGTGLEARKQYIIIQEKPAGPGTAS